MPTCLFVRQRSRWAMLTVAVAGLLSLTACSAASFVSMTPRLPPLLGPTSSSTSGSASRSASPAESAPRSASASGSAPGSGPGSAHGSGSVTGVVATGAPAVTVLRRPGALDTGTAAHVLDAAGLHLVLTYWTSDDATAWGPASQGQVQLSAQVRGVPDERLVTVTRVAVLAPPTSPHGSDVTLLDDRGSFVVVAPYTYQTAFALPVYPPGTPGITLTITVDLLVPTAPNAATYTRLTQQDRLYLSTTPTTHATT